jgi:enolase
VRRAVEHVNGEIAAGVRGREAADQRGLDRALIDLDGTANKQRLGANAKAILGVSLAVARAHAAQVGLPLWRCLGDERAELLPTPLMNVLNGAVHADNGVDFQEFMIVPLGAAPFAQALEMGAETSHHTLSSAAMIDYWERLVDRYPACCLRTGCPRTIGMGGAL